LICEIERNQTETAKEIEYIYEKKVELQNEKYLALEAAILEQQFKNEHLFTNIESTNKYKLQDLTEDFQGSFYFT
jgi:hypothetical protein